jgi:hypothetical protein
MLPYSIYAILLPVICTIAPSVKALQAEVAQQQKPAGQVDLDYRAFLKLRVDADAAKQDPEQPSSATVANTLSEYGTETEDVKDANGIGAGEGNGEVEDSGEGETADVATPDPIDTAETTQTGNVDTTVSQSDNSASAEPTSKSQSSPVNPAADPNSATCGSISRTACENKAAVPAKDTICWDCYDTFRDMYCTKLMTNSPPTWNTECAQDTTVLQNGRELRDEFCAMFSVEDSPKLEEPCFFPDSTYKDEYCTKTYKTGFSNRCAQDSELSESYCKHWAGAKQGLLKCMSHRTFMETYCEAKGNDTEFDDTCATDSLLGSAFCLNFATEADMRNSCQSHGKYLDMHCKKKAQDSVADTVCATNAGTKNDYCTLLASKLEKMDECWLVDGWHDYYCNLVNYEDEECVREKKTTAAGGGGLLEKASIHKFHPKRITPTSLAQISEVDDVEESVRALIRDGDTKSMDIRLPAGWRSGWDSKHARFYFFPVEKNDGEWQPVPGFRPSWEEPRLPFSGTNTQRAAAMMSMISRRLHKKKPVKTFGMRAGVHLWEAKQAEHKKLHQRRPDSQDDDEVQLNSALQETVQTPPVRRGPILVRREDGSYDFPGTAPS